MANDSQQPTIEISEEEYFFLQERNKRLADVEAWLDEQRES